MPRPKILILGLDGMTFDVIRPLIRRGSLPAMARMMEAGTQAALKSTVMPNSFPAWTSLTTGVNPGKHGIFWSLIRPEGGSHDLRLMSSRDIGARRIWHLLGDEGFRVGVFNVPTEYPPSPVNGFLVCGALTPDVSRSFTFPEALRDEILGAVPDYRCEIDYARMDLEGLAGALLRSIEARERVLLQLMKDKPWDFLMAVFTESDLAQHRFWAGIDPRHPRHARFREGLAGVVHDVYVRLDETLGKILDAAPADASVLVVSDHGFGPFYQSFSLPLWLKDNGYLTLEDARPRSFAQSLLKSAGLWNGARAVRDRLQALRFKLQGKTSVRDMRDRDAAAGKERLGRIRWDRTRAYFAPDYGIRLNLKGRDPQGIVEPGEEARRLSEDIKKKLEACAYSNGAPVFEAVLSSSEAFQGPFIDRAPDIVVPINHAGAPSRPETWPFTLTHPTLTGTHTPYGIFLAQGPGIRKNHRLEEAGVLDVAPTILGLGNVPVPSEMDGRVLREIFEDGMGERNDGAGTGAKP